MPQKRAGRQKRKKRRLASEEQEPVWTKRSVRLKKKLKKEGDHEGLRKLNLGKLIYSMRKNAGLSQQQAATMAGITRVAWIRIEKGRCRPRQFTLQGIAEAIRTDYARLAERAGYPIASVPPDVGTAFRQFRSSLQHSFSTVQFLMDMCLLWQEYKADELGIRKRFEFDPRIPEAIAYVKTRLSFSQQLQLAIGIVRSTSPQEWQLEQFNPSGFIKLVDYKLAQCQANAKEVPERENS